jgi:hypothetical protein
VVFAFWGKTKKEKGNTREKGKQRKESKGGYFPFIYYA